MICWFVDLLNAPRFARRSKLYVNSPSYGDIALNARFSDGIDYYFVYDGDTGIDGAIAGFGVSPVMPSSTPSGLTAFGSARSTMPAR